MRCASMPSAAAPSEATASTTNNAGWPLASRAARSASRSLVTPLAVSVCTTNTAAISRAVSWRRACSTAPASMGSPSCHGVRRARRPSASTCSAHWSEKCPVPGTSAVPPGGSRFSMAASQAPWPLAAYMNTPAEAEPASHRRPSSQACSVAARRGSARSTGCRCMAHSTSSGTWVGPGECSSRCPGMRGWEEGGMASGGPVAGHKPTPGPRPRAPWPPRLSAAARRSFPAAPRA